MSERPTTIPPFVESTDGVRVRIHDLGGRGPLLVLSHATGFCGGVWRPFATALADHFHCVALDYRGHGETERPGGVELVWTEFADDLSAVLDVLSPNAPARVVGHSMGGAAIALAGAARPGRIASAFAFEPIFVPMGVETRSGMPEAARRRRATAPSRAEALERFGSKPPLSIFDPDALAAYVEYGFADEADGSIRLRCDPEDEAATFEHAASGAYEAVAKIDFPYCVALGEPTGPVEMARSADEANPGVLTIAEYPDLTHFGPLQAPERLAADVVAWFLDDESPGNVRP